MESNEDNLVWYGDIRLELFLASSRYPRRDEYVESSNLMEIIRLAGAIGQISIVYLKSLKQFSENKELFDSLKDPDTTSRLPYMIGLYGCTTGSFLGYTGLDQIIDQLTSINLLPRELSVVKKEQTIINV